MRIAVCGDVHVSKVSSIIRSKGTKFTTRLENAINSLNWFEDISQQNQCDLEIFLGDTFDKPILDDEIITALKEVDWNSTNKYFLVGNHESTQVDLTYTSADYFKVENSFEVVKKITYLTDNKNKLYLFFIPYIIESNRKTLTEYFNEFSELNPSYQKIVFSHNDLKGIQLGKFISEQGFDLEDIESNCKLFVNGHIHNENWITPKILNLGILTGQNFNEDAFVYPHNIAIIDTDKLSLDLIENPHAFNFYKLKIEQKKDLRLLDSLKSNAVVSITCLEDFIKDVKEKIEKLSTIAESRVVLTRNLLDLNTEEVKTEDLTIDHLEKFREFCIEKIENTPILKEELCEICK